MNIETLAILITAIASLLTSVGGSILAYRIQRKKDQATDELAKKKTEQELLDKVWRMTQDNIDELKEQLLTERQDKERLIQLVETLQTSLDAEREKRRTVESRLQNMMLAFSAYRGGLMLLITQIQEMGVEPHWQPPKENFFYDD